MQIVDPQTRVAALALSLAALSVQSWAGAPTVTKHGEWIAHDFKFHGGAVLPELHIRYTTVGERSGEPVLILHGTGDTGDGFADGGIRRAAVRPRPASRRRQVLHHPAGRDRPRGLVQAVRWAQDEVS